MSRNGSGTYTLPSGNPVVSGTLIEASWANTTLDDLASAMTDSLSRTGQGGMQAALRLYDGTSSVPGLAWGSETTTGWYRAGAGDMRLVVTGSQVVKYLATGVDITGTLSASGNATVGGTLGVTGASTFTGAATFNGGISGSPVINAGTANGVAYLNGSKVLTTGSALTFDGNSQTITHTSGYGLAVTRSTKSLTFNGNYASANTNADINSDLPVSFSLSGSEQMRLTSTGLGIGTSSPGVKLDISGAVARIVGPTATTASFQVYSNAKTTGGLVLAQGYGSGSDNIAWISNDSNADLLFRTNATERARIDSSGNFGIGTSSPSAKLDVAGQIRGVDRYYFKRASDNYSLSFVARWDGSTGSPLTGTAGIYTVLGSEEASSGVIFAPSNTERMRLDSSGNLGLGVTPSAWAYAKALQVGDFSLAYYSGQNNSLATNSYLSAAGGGTQTYIANGYAMQYQQYAGKHIWYTAPSGTAGNAITFTQAMTLDASGNLAVQNTNSSGWLYSGVSAGSGSSDAAFTTYSGSSNYGAIAFADSTSGTARYAGLIQYFHSNDSMQFYTASAERARIDSSGNLLVGVTSQISVAGSNGAHCFSTATAANWASVFQQTNANPLGVAIRYSTDSNNTSNDFLYCVGNATLRASIRSNGGLANYSANDVNLSDRREKTNFAPAGEYLSKICAIPVQTFNYIDQNLEEDAGLTLGVVAQDVQAVAPELVMESNWGSKDEPKMRLSIYQTDLQYALMKCIQEQQAIINQLKARLDAANL